ncbi:MAG: hypothetical protein WCL02_07390 [bacterium]
MNNNVVLVDAPLDIQRQRIAHRGVPEEKIDRILASQHTTTSKRGKIIEAIQRDHHGKIIDIQSPYSQQDAEILFNKVLAQVDTFGELRFQ